MKVLIVEDEKIAADRLEIMLKEIDSDIDIEGKIDSVEESVRWLNQHTVDLIFFRHSIVGWDQFQYFRANRPENPGHLHNRLR